MLRRLEIRGFKSLRSVDVELANLVVLFGPNAAGKSNLLEALVLLSRLVRERTLADAFDEGIRGYPLEAFSLPHPEKPELPRLSLQADMEAGKDRIRYRVGVRGRPDSGELALVDEYLDGLNRKGAPMRKATVELVPKPEGGARFHVRRKVSGSHPYEEPVGIGHTLASNLQYSGDRFPRFDALRREVGGWRVVYLDPREAMRRSQPPREVDDIGERGQFLVPFLHRLSSNPQHQQTFRGIVRAAQAVIPSLDDVKTELVPARGEVDLSVVQDGLTLPGRVVSEGTLRVLALAAMVANPFHRGLLAFEEPENGVHPRRIEVISRVLARASLSRQVVVSTHSPLVVSQVVHMIRTAEIDAAKVRLLQCSGGPEGTRVSAFDPAGPLFQEEELRRALLAAEDEHLVQAAILRGWLDA